MGGCTPWERHGGTGWGWSWGWQPALPGYVAVLLLQNLQLQNGCREHSAGRHQRGALTDSL